MLAVLFLLLGICTGTLSYRCLIPRRHRYCGPETLAAGVVLGTLITSWLPFVLAYVIGFTRGTLLVALAITAAAAGFLLNREFRTALRPEIYPWVRKSLIQWTRSPRHAAFLAVFLVVEGGLAYLFHTHILQDRGGGNLYSGGSVWGDLAVHLSIISSIVYGDNFPLDNPVYTGYRLGYHFMPDVQSAGLMLLGLNLRWSILLPSVLISAALVTLVYYFACGLTGRGRSALLASVLFWLNGGLGFIYVLDDKRGSALSWWTYLASAPHNANMNEAMNIQWVNYVCDIFLPQRASLFGFTMGVLVLLLLYRALEEARTPAERRPLFGLAGIVVGLIPLMHTSSFPTLLMIATFWAVLALPAWTWTELKRDLYTWLWFFLPALVLMVPQALLYIIPQVGQGGGSFMRFNLDWVNRGDPWAWFWFKNVGLVFLLLLPAYWRTPNPLRRMYLPFLVLFIGLEFVSLQPNAYDNLKYYLYWYLVSAVLVGDLLAEMLDSGFVGFYLALCLLVLGSLSGTLAIARDMATHFLMFTDRDAQIAKVVRERTPPRAVFLTSDLHRHAVPCLAGRRVVLGYKGWLWTWGFNYAQRERDVAEIYAAGPQTSNLLRKYGVDFVFLGSNEREKLHPNESYWRANYPVLYRSDADNVTIFQVGSRQ